MRRQGKKEKKEKKKGDNTAQNIAICSGNFSRPYFFPVKPQSKANLPAPPLEQSLLHAMS
jgi:hypothetical protein